MLNIILVRVPNKGFQESVRKLADVTNTQVMTAPREFNCGPLDELSFNTKFIHELALGSIGTKFYNGGETSFDLNESYRLLCVAENERFGESRGFFTFLELNVDFENNLVTQGALPRSKAVLPEDLSVFLTKEGWDKFLNENCSFKKRFAKWRSTYENLNGFFDLGIAEPSWSNENPYRRLCRVAKDSGGFRVERFNDYPIRSIESHPTFLAGVDKVETATDLLALTNATLYELRYGAGPECYWAFNYTKDYTHIIVAAAVLDVDYMHGFVADIDVDLVSPGCYKLQFNGETHYYDIVTDEVPTEDKVLYLINSEEPPAISHMYPAKGCIILPKYYFSKEAADSFRKTFGWPLVFKVPGRIDPEKGPMLVMDYVKTYERFPGAGVTGTEERSIPSWFENAFGLDHIKEI